MDSWISGDDSCKTFKDDTKMKPSYLCYALVFLIVVGVVTNLVHVTTYPAYSLTHATLGAGLAYVMYENCAKCNGWRGFLITAAVAIVVGIVLQALPISKPPDMWWTGGGPVNATCPQGGCDQRSGVNVSCDGGRCDQRGAVNPSCSGGGCDQTGTVNSTCTGGGCAQGGSVNAS